MGILLFNLLIVLLILSIYVYGTMVAPPPVIRTDSQSYFFTESRVCYSLVCSVSVTDKTPKEYLLFSYIEGQQKVERFAGYSPVLFRLRDIAVELQCEDSPATESFMKWLDQLEKGVWL